MCFFVYVSGENRQVILELFTICHENLDEVGVVYIFYHTEVIFILHHLLLGCLRSGTHG